MEITTLSDTSIKIRGKQSAFAINPLNLKTKTTAQGALFFQKLKLALDTKHFEEEPVIIQGPGDYEINGVKITGNKAGEGYLYQMTLDGIDILIAKGSYLAKAKDTITEYQLVLLDADTSIDQSVITALNPNVIIFFGEKKVENAKAFGQEVSPVTKYAITKDKLPADTQVIVL